MSFVAIVKIVLGVMKFLPQVFELFSLVPEGVGLTTEQVRDLLSSFKNMPTSLGSQPTMKDLRVSYPAVILTAVAIFL